MIDATPEWGAYQLVHLITTRTAIAQDFTDPRDVGKINWEAVQARYDMLSSGEKAIISLAAELADVRIDTDAPALYRVLEWCDNEYKLYVANVLTQVLLPR